MNNPVEKPPCADWALWVGTEIEGRTDIGENTLFVRGPLPPSLTPESDLSMMNRGGKIQRVWFCKEFRNWELLKAIAKHFRTVCVECTPTSLVSIPRVIRDSSTIYMKVTLGPNNGLKPGDYVCVGPTFADESFQIGTGAKVEPTLYLNDTKIL